jgi:hypothetical protein
VSDSSIQVSLLNIWLTMSVLSRSGDRQGLVHAVMEICADRAPTVQAPFALHSSIGERKKLLQTHDYVYLEAKGVFDVPSTDVCDALVRDYFHHVHALLPVIDAGNFLSQYVSRGVSSMNLLLLWSVFLAAANVGLQSPLPFYSY